MREENIKMISSELPQIIRGLPFDKYHAIPAINASGLKLIHKKSALHYLASRSEQQESSALLVGHAGHTAVLEPDTFDERYAVFAEGLTKQTTVGKNEWARLEKTGKTILRFAEYRDAKALAAAAHAHPTVSEILNDGDAELTIVTEIDGIPAKARLDFLQGPFIYDLKTAEDCSYSAFSRSILNYGYDVQAAWYIDCARAAGLEIEAFRFIAVESSAPYAISIYQLDPDSVEIGRTKYQRALAVYAECDAFDQWPGYSNEIQMISLPAYAMREAA